MLPRLLGSFSSTSRRLPVILRYERSTMSTDVLLIAGHPRFADVAEANPLGLRSYWNSCVAYPPLTSRRITEGFGSVLLIAGATTLLLALDWGGGTYAWYVLALRNPIPSCSIINWFFRSDKHVVAPLVVGLALLIIFGLYEAYGRSDGIVAHVFCEFAYLTCRQCPH